MTMFDVFTEFQELVPIKTCQKFRKDEAFTIVTNISNEYFYLNETASSIFLMCNGENSINSIYKSIFSEYEVSEGILKKDVVRIIRDLQWKRLIKLKKVKENRI